MRNVTPARITALILIVALALRLGVFAIIWISTMQLDDPAGSRAFNGGDSDDYILLAHNMVEHDAFSVKRSPPFTPDMNRTPGYPALLAALYVLAGGHNDPVLIIALQVLLSVFNVWLVIRIGNRLLTPQTGWLAGCLYALAPATLIFTGVVMTETVFATVLLGGTLMCIQMFDSVSRRVWLYAGLAGLSFAALAYTRPIALYFVPIPALALLVKLKWSARAFGLTGIMLLGFGAAVAPWFYRNYVHFDAAIFTSIGNTNLLLYNVSSIEAHRQQISWDSAKEQVWEELGQRTDLEYTNPNAAERSALAGKLAREHILRHPVDAILYQTLDMVNLFRPGYSMLNLILYDEGEEIGIEVQDGNFDVLLEGSSLDLILYGLMTLYYGVFYVVMCVGGLLLFWRRQWVTLILIGLSAFFFLYLPGRAGNARFRAPLEGHLALIGAVGLTAIVQGNWFAAWRRRLSGHRHRSADM